MIYKNPIVQRPIFFPRQYLSVSASSRLEGVRRQTWHFLKSCRASPVGQVQTVTSISLSAWADEIFETRDFVLRPGMKTREKEEEEGDLNFLEQEQHCRNG
jgi:hypothetical protein